jgi:DHA1 family inner membrane transport protein
MSSEVLDEPAKAVHDASAITAPHGLLAAILTLALGGLLIGTGEFVAMSLLPALAASTGVSIPAAGGYISAYAVGVVVGAPAIAIMAARAPRRLVLMVLLAIATAGNLASAFASTHGTLMAARFLSGLPHGAYYGVACLLAAAMVPDNQKARAAGYVMSGLAAANVIGVPLGTWLGQASGWRSTFIAIGAGGVLSILLFMLYVPSIAAARGASPVTELRGLRRPQLWLTLGVASIGFGGMFAVYSYITPTLMQVTGFGAGAVPLVLACWGVGMIVGNLVGGRLADRALVPAIFGMLAWNALFLALFSVTAESRVGTLVVLFLIGCGFALVPALQVRLMNVAGEAQTLAASLNHSAFNLSNAIGAAVGGFAIAHGAGWASTGWVGAILAVLGIGLMLVSVSKPASNRPVRH